MVCVCYLEGVKPRDRFPRPTGTRKGDAMRFPIITAICVECRRVFNLEDETDGADWFYGHDCEVTV